MEFIIKNEYLEAHISSLGAECRSIVDRHGFNRLHDGNPSIWNGVSPILFPQISRTKNNSYSVEGKEYMMASHGFVRKTEANLVERHASAIVFSFSDNEETRKNYPYNFTLYVKYELIKQSMIVSFKVENKSNKDMLFMIGGHPGIRIPLNDNEAFSDYYLEFPKEEEANALQVIDGFLSNEEKPYLKKENVINLNRSLFIPDAIVLKNLKSKYVDLMSKKSEFHIRFHYEDFPILAIWSPLKENANFVCLEPWLGIPKNFVYELEKKGVLSLEKNREFNCQYAIEFLDLL